MIEKIEEKIENFNDLNNQERDVHDWMVLLNIFFEKTLINIDNTEQAKDELPFYQYDINLDFAQDLSNKYDLYSIIEFIGLFFGTDNLDFQNLEIIFADDFKSKLHKIIGRENLIAIKQLDNKTSEEQIYNLFSKVYFLRNSLVVNQKYSKEDNDLDSNWIGKEDILEIKNSNDMIFFDSFFSIFYFINSYSSSVIEEFISKMFPNVIWETENDLIKRNFNLFRKLKLIGINTQNDQEYKLLKDVFNFFKNKTKFQIYSIKQWNDHNSTFDQKQQDSILQKKIIFERFFDLNKERYFKNWTYDDTFSKWFINDTFNKQKFSNIYHSSQIFRNFVVKSLSLFFDFNYKTDLVQYEFPLIEKYVTRLYDVVLKSFLKETNENSSTDNYNNAKIFVKGFINEVRHEFFLNKELFTSSSINKNIYSSTSFLKLIEHFITDLKSVTIEEIINYNLEKNVSIIDNSDPKEFDKSLSIILNSKKRFLVKTSSNQKYFDKNKFVENFKFLNNILDKNNKDISDLEKQKVIYEFLYVGTIKNLLIRYLKNYKSQMESLLKEKTIYFVHYFNSIEQPIKRFNYPLDIKNLKYYNRFPTKWEFENVYKRMIGSFKRLNIKNEDSKYELFNLNNSIIKELRTPKTFEDIKENYLNLFENSSNKFVTNILNDSISISLINNEAFKGINKIISIWFNYLTLEDIQKTFNNQQILFPDNIKENILDNQRKIFLIENTKNSSKLFNELKKTKFISDSSWKKLDDAFDIKIENPNYNWYDDNSKILEEEINPKLSCKMYIFGRKIDNLNEFLNLSLKDFLKHNNTTNSNDKKEFDLNDFWTLIGTKYLFQLTDSSQRKIDLIIGNRDLKQSIEYFENLKNLNDFFNENLNLFRNNYDNVVLLFIFNYIFNFLEQKIPTSIENLKKEKDFKIFETYENSLIRKIFISLNDQIGELEKENLIEELKIELRHCNFIFEPNNYQKIAKVTQKLNKKRTSDLSKLLASIFPKNPLSNSYNVFNSEEYISKYNLDYSFFYKNIFSLKDFLVTKFSKEISDSSKHNPIYLMKKDIWFEILKGLNIDPNRKKNIDFSSFLNKNLNRNVLFENELLGYLDDFIKKMSLLNKKNTQNLSKIKPLMEIQRIIDFYYQKYFYFLFDLNKFLNKKVIFYKIRNLELDFNKHNANGSNIIFTIEYIKKISYEFQNRFSLSLNEPKDVILFKNIYSFYLDNGFESLTDNYILESFKNNDSSLKKFLDDFFFKCNQKASKLKLNLEKNIGNKELFEKINNFIDKQNYKDHKKYSQSEQIIFLKEIIQEFTLDILY